MCGEIFIIDCDELYTFRKSNPMKVFEMEISLNDLQVSLN